MAVKIWRPFGDQTDAIRGSSVRHCAVVQQQFCAVEWSVSKSASKCQCHGCSVVDEHHMNGDHIWATIASAIKVREDADKVAAGKAEKSAGTCMQTCQHWQIGDFRDGDGYVNKTTRTVSSDGNATACGAPIRDTVPTGAVDAD